MVVCTGSLPLLKWKPVPMSHKIFFANLNLSDISPSSSYPGTIEDTWLCLTSKIQTLYTLVRFLDFQLIMYRYSRNKSEASFYSKTTSFTSPKYEKKSKLIHDYLTIYNYFLKNRLNNIPYIFLYRSCNHTLFLPYPFSNSLLSSLRILQYF